MRLPKSTLVLAVLVFGLRPVGVSGQGTAHGHQDGAQATPARASEPEPETEAPPDASAMFFMQQSSGTGTQPSSWPMPMLMRDRGAWRLGLMGQAFLVYTEQSGRRGQDGAYAVNWIMGSAARPLGSGGVQFRAMASLEPATVDDRRYPLLFQTGETAYGEPIVDGQHPHDFLMELSAQYSRPLGRAGLVHAYYAVTGDPAIGPVAFPHRASALELPQATLGHHWEDSTHIASNVLTLGWSTGPLHLEASAFHGAEPDEARWNLEVGGMDSWSVRASVAPRPDWMGQLSFAHLRHPEALQPDDVDRTTASVHHVAPRPHGNALATSIIWAMNHKTLADTRTQALTIENVVPFGARNFVSTRVEWSQRDELFESDHALAHELEHATGKTAFDVSALTVGYTRDLLAASGVQLGVGGSLTRYWADAALAPYYGARPWGATVFVRVRAKGQPAAAMHHGM